MIERITEFSDLLRRNRVQVSPAELIDAVSAIELVGLSDPRLVRQALVATLARSRRDAELVAELFDLYFLRRGSAAGAAGSAPLVEALARAGLSPDQIEHVLALLADEASRLDPTAWMGLGLRRADLTALIRLSGLSLDLSRLQNPLQLGFYAQQMLSALGLAGGRPGPSAEESIDAVLARLLPAIGAEAAGVVREVSRSLLDGLRRDARELVRAEFDRRNLRFMEDFRSEQLQHKPFGAMSEAELAALRREVVRLGRRLRDRARRRPARRRRGRLDARATIRRALSTGGVPVSLRYRRTRRERPRLVILCDISDSVRHVSRFMLQLAFTLQEMFSKVRSFVFVSDLGECTELFREHDLGRAVDLVWQGRIVSVFANSNYGRAFGQFHARHLESITGRTTVVVIGDGRSNYNPPEAWALGEIRARARRVVWLNPEPPMSWAFGDSVMREYEPHCDRVETVHNLASLEEVIDRWVL